METLQKVLHPQSLLQSERVVIVTDSDEGIGYEVVKSILHANPNWVVYITCPDMNAGEAAVKRCYDDIKLTPKFYPLDIDEINSIRQFRDHIRENHKNGIHILVNNAGIYPDIRAGSSARTGFEASGQAAKEFRAQSGEQKMEESKFKYDKEVFKTVIQSNYFSTLQVCQELFPLLGDNSSVIFVGSRLANLAFLHTKEDKQFKLRACVKIDDCSALMESLMKTDPEKLTEEWLTESPDTEVIPNYYLGVIYPWAMAKLGLAIICRIYQLQFDSEKHNKNVHIVTCCPGLVKTDLNPYGTRTPEKGADTIVWMALQPKESPIRGMVCADRKVMDPLILPEDPTIFNL